MNNNIAKIVLDITNNIQLYEKSLKQFVKENINNTTDNIIKLNMQQTLYKNISDFTKKFKLNQEIYAKKYKELVFEDDPTYEINSTKKEENIENNNEDESSTEENEKDKKYYDGNFWRVEIAPNDDIMSAVLNDLD